MSQVYTAKKSDKFHLFRIFEKYLEIFKISYRSTFAYILDALSNTINYAIRLLIFNQLYIATYSSLSVETIDGLKRSEVIWMLMFVQSFHLSLRLLIDIINDIKSGQISVFLNKPFYFPLFQLSEFLGQQGVKCFINIIFGSIITYFLVGGFNFQITSLLLAIPLMIGTIILAFVQVFTFALISFWIEDSSAIFRIYSKLDMVLGGSIFPPSLFPGILKNISLLLPFANGSFVVGRCIVAFQKDEYTKALILQLLWITFFTSLIGILYKKGVKKLVIQGG